MRGAAHLAPLLCVAMAAVARAAEPSAGTETALLDGAADVIVRRAVIAREGDTHGEVRLVRRGSAMVVQTLLESRVVRRVARAIAAKEAHSWPAGTAGHDASLAYVAALEEVAASVARAHARHDPRRRHPQRLVIEFVRADDRAFVALYELPVGDLSDRDHLLHKRIVKRLDLSHDYVERNMILIAVDALGIGEAGARRALGLATADEPAPASGESSSRDDTATEPSRAGAPALPPR